MRLSRGRSRDGGRPAEATDDEGGEPLVAVRDRGWRRLVRGADRVALRAARAAGGGATVVLDSDRAVRRLNGRFRGRNKPTNVLTFEAAPGARGGDIVLALGVVRREASTENKRPAHHLAHLVVHGCLHLGGHDHGRAGDARRMEAAETLILRRIGMPNPWKARRIAGGGR